MQFYLIAACCALTILAGPVLYLGQAVTEPTSATNVYLVVSGPDKTFRETLIRQSGGSKIGPFNAPWSSFATADRANFAEIVRNGGAWVVVAAGPLADICGIEL